MLTPQDFPVLDAFAIEQAAEARWMAEVDRLTEAHQARIDDLQSHMLRYQKIHRDLANRLEAAGFNPLPTSDDAIDAWNEEIAAVATDGMNFRTLLAAIKADENLSAIWDRLVVLIGLSE